MTTELLTTAEAAQRLGDKEAEYQRRKKKEKAAQLRRNRLEQGVCVRCGCPERKEGRVTCERCARIRAEEAAKRRQRDNKRMNQLARIRDRQVREEALRKFGGVCACCGETEIKFLCIDHINGRAATRTDARRQVGRPWYQWLIAHGTAVDFQVLCHNCNCAKGFYGWCPHQPEPEETSSPIRSSETKRSRSEKTLSTEEAAKILGITPRRVLALIKAGRLPAEKWARDWRIAASDLARVERRKVGRPRKGEDHVDG